MQLDRPKVANGWLVAEYRQLPVVPTPLLLQMSEKLAVAVAVGTSVSVLSDFLAPMNIC